MIDTTIWAFTTNHTAQDFSHGDIVVYKRFPTGDLRVTGFSDFINVPDTPPIKFVEVKSNEHPEEKEVYKIFPGLLIFSVEKALIQHRESGYHICLN